MDIVNISNYKFEKDRMQNLKFRETIKKKTLFNETIIKMKFGEVTIDPDSNIQNFEKEFLKAICLPGDEDNYEVILTDSCTNAIEACIAFNYYHNRAQNIYRIPNQVYHSVWSAIKKGNPEAQIELTGEIFTQRYKPFNGVADHSLVQYNKNFTIREVFKNPYQGISFICLSFSRGKIYENLEFRRGGVIIFKKNYSKYSDKYIYSWLKRYNHNGRDSNINVNFDFNNILVAEITKKKKFFGFTYKKTIETIILGNKQNHIHELVELPLKKLQKMLAENKTYLEITQPEQLNTDRYPKISNILKHF